MKRGFLCSILPKAVAFYKLMITEQDFPCLSGSCAKLACYMCLSQPPYNWVILLTLFADEKTETQREIHQLAQKHPASWQLSQDLDPGPSDCEVCVLNTLLSK